MTQGNETIVKDKSEALSSFSSRTGRIFFLLLLLSFALNWYYLLGRFHLEDMAFVSMTRQDTMSFSRWNGFWSIDDIPAFTNLWWREDGASGTFWRPIPSLVIEASLRLFGETPFPLHLLSILLHGCVAFAIYLLTRMLTGRSLIALFAAILFLACEDNTMTIGWIATGTDILCVLFSILALIAHANWLQRRNPLALASSLAALLVALGSKESASMAPLAMVLMSALMPAGHDTGENAPFTRISTLRENMASFLRDWLSWAPALAVLVVFISVYKGFGLGEMVNLMYVDPLSQPLNYIKHLVLHLPIMWLATITILPPSIAMFSPEFLVPLAAVGLAGFLAWIVAFWPMRKRAVAVWAMLTYLCALLPQMGADASERGMYFPYVSAAILLALFIADIGPWVPRNVLKDHRGPFLTRAFGWYALIGILVSGMFLSAVYPFSFLPSFHALEDQTLTALPHIREKNSEHIVMLNTSGFMNTIYPPIIMEYHVGRPLDIRILSSCNSVMTVERTGNASFIIRSDRRGWLSNMFANVVRVEPMLESERIYRNDLFSATLLELTDDGLDALAVRFDMSSPLNDGSLLFLYWNGKSFLPLDLAMLPEGEQQELADTSNIWASMM